jgi:hypothetical protein
LNWFLLAFGTPYCPKCCFGYRISQDAALEYRVSQNAVLGYRISQDVALEHCAAQNMALGYRISQDIALEYCVPQNMVLGFIFPRMLLWDVIYIIPHFGWFVKGFLKILK